MIGEILADLSMVGETAWPIEPFRADRFEERLQPAATDAGSGT